MRIIIRTSKLASWSRRLGSIALPIFVLSIIMHRSQSITSETFHLLISISFIIASLALITSLISLVQLWFSGDKGWSRAFVGLTLGIICLSPLAYASIQAQKYPDVSDVSTNPELNLSLIQNTSNKLKTKTLLDQRELLTYFPNMVARNYQISGEELYNFALEQISQLKWQIINSQTLSANNKTAQINAIDTTLFGWRDEIAILIIENEFGASIEMRSASKLAKNDLGKNGKRIETFLVNLDAAVIKYSSSILGSESPPTPLEPRN